MDYALEKLVEERNSLYTQREFTEKHIRDYENKLGSLKREIEWNEKSIKDVEEAIRKLER